MAKKRVLLVDDDEVFVEAISAVLESRYQIVRAVNGSEALKMIREKAPDLVVLDVMMDHLSEGFDVARTMRKNPETKGIPIIMLTGVDQVYNVRMETDPTWVPCERYLEKPIEPKELLSQVSELIG